MSGLPGGQNLPERALKKALNICSGESFAADCLLSVIINPELKNSPSQIGSHVSRLISPCDVASMHLGFNR